MKQLSMKPLPLLILTLIIFQLTAQAQSFSGVWRGTLASSQNQAIAMPATIAFRLAGSQLTDSMILQNNGVNE